MWVCINIYIEKERSALKAMGLTGVHLGFCRFTLTVAPLVLTVIHLHHWDLVSAVDFVLLKGE